MTRIFTPTFWKKKCSLVHWMNEKLLLSFRSFEMLSVYLHLSSFLRSSLRNCFCCCIGSGRRWRPGGQINLASKMDKNTCYLNWRSHLSIRTDFSTDHNSQWKTRQSWQCLLFEGESLLYLVSQASIHYKSTSWTRRKLRKHAKAK